MQGRVPGSSPRRSSVAMPCGYRLISSGLAAMSPEPTGTRRHSGHGVPEAVYHQDSARESPRGSVSGILVFGAGECAPMIAREVPRFASIGCYTTSINVYGSNRLCEGLSGVAIEEASNLRAPSRRRTHSVEGISHGHRAEEVLKASASSALFSARHSRPCSEA